LDAISEFVNSMSSYRSKYDKELDKHYENSLNLNNIAGANFSGFSAAENLGKDLYVTNCGNCHGAINGFPSEVQANNGLDMAYEDQGIGEIEGVSQNGIFKVPTLRNIEMTGPYMHDGRFTTLEEVVDHYSNGVQNHPNLSFQLKQGGQPKALNFTQNEKDALIAFLNTFTDQESLTDIKYSDPFK